MKIESRIALMVSKKIETRNKREEENSMTRNDKIILVLFQKNKNRR